jgi:uncharacterized membrane protein YdjX (TVP38/TMEM64 family)
LLAGLVVAVALAVAYAGPGLDEVALAVGWLRDQGALGCVLFAVVYAICAAAMVPATPFPLTAGFLWGPLVGFVVTWVGEVAGALVGFALGRTLLRERAEALASRYRILGALDHALEEGGFRLLVMLRLSPVFPFGALNMSLGLTSVPAPAFAASTALGVMPASFVLVYAGASLTALTAALAGDVELGWGETLLTWGGLAVTTLVVGWVGRATTRALNAQVPADPPG